MIHHVMLSALNEGDGPEKTEPPERYLRIDVVCGVAHMWTVKLSPGGLEEEVSEFTVAVDAGSLVRATQVQLDDEEQGGLGERRGRRAGGVAGNDRW